MSDGSYYADKPVKGSGTGGQVNPQSEKSVEIIVWIYKRRPGTRIRRDDPPASHHVNDLALKNAERMNLVTPKPHVRTGIGWPDPADSG